MHSLSKSGFTLVEISIVLVIIALIAAGVLVGRDLIAAAQVRAQVSQIQKYMAGVNAFRVKYGELPGDMRAATAQQLGFIPRSGEIARGDGNGKLATCEVGGLVYSDRFFGCETALFWADMSQAGLVDGSFTQAVDDYIDTENISLYLPTGKIGNSNVAVFSSAVMEPLALPSAGRCQDSFCFALVSRMVTVGGGNILAGESVTPIQAYNIDLKIDDGLPRTGNVLGGSTGSSGGMGFTLYYIPNNPSNTRCSSSKVSGSVENIYYVTQDRADEVRCYLNFVYK